MGSRKFLLCLAVMIAIVVIGAVAPDFPPEMVDKLIWVALGWTGIEGAKEIVAEARGKAGKLLELPRETPTEDGNG